MMKWKVVKNPRCVSADRSLDCLKEKSFPNCISDSNNNTQCKQDPNSQKENNKQQDSGFIRKPSLVASDCINWKGFLGLTRQRSEINLSNLGLISNEPRRSRSEVRGISCDRLTIGYHTPSLPVVGGNTKSQNASPPTKSGWLRGRKRERETRNSTKANTEPPGKTIVTGCSSRRANSKPNESRTITDQAGEGKKSSSRLSIDGRKTKPNKKDNGDNIVEEEIIYSEIEHNASTKLLKESVTVSKGPIKLGRKKGQAPKPNVLLKESKCDVNLNPNGIETKEPTNCFIEKKASPSIKPSKKLQNSIERNQIDNRSMQTAKLNNAVNSETFLTVKNKISSVVAIAEVHKNNLNDYSSAEKKSIEDVDNNNFTSKKSSIESGISNENSISGLHEIESNEEKERVEEIQIEIPPFRIDTPDYSTLESEFEQNKTEQSVPDGIIINNFKNNSSLNDNSSSDYKTSNVSDKGDLVYEGTISSILRGSSNDIRNCDSEQTSKKMVRFEKIDLIETYKKNKAESSKESDEDSVLSISEQKPQIKKLLDVNSNEIVNPESRVDSPEISIPGHLEKHSSSSSECLSECSATSYTDTEFHQKSMRVNVLVKNPSTECLLTNCVVDSHVDEAQTQLVVKKSFVLTIAKQEKGFKSLCANKKPEVINEVPKKDHKISVTFVCSEAANERCPKAPPPLPSALRIRSVSVPPQQQHATEVIAVMPPPLVRGRSRDRRSKERQHSKKSKSSKKKDTSFHMPQAVIDELAQVLEKRKPSLDRPTANAK